MAPSAQIKLLQVGQPPGTTRAKILGPIRIGDSVAISADAAFITDVPSSCIAACIPARNRPSNPAQPAESLHSSGSRI